MNEVTTDKVCDNHSGRHRQPKRLTSSPPICDVTRRTLQTNEVLIVDSHESDNTFRPNTCLKVLPKLDATIYSSCHIIFISYSKMLKYEKIDCEELKRDRDDFDT